MMSKCPYAAQWVNGFQNSVLSKPGLKDIVTVTMNYIAKVDKSQPSGFYSLHGQTEVYGDLNELCVIDFLPNWLDWWTFVLCVDKDYTKIPDNVSPCANAQKINLKTLNTCVHGNQSRTLMTNSIATTDSLGWNPRPGSPTVYINKKRCISGYDPCENISGSQLLKAICDAYTGPKPAGCPK